MELDSEEIVSEDVSGVSQDHLDSRDEELRSVYKFMNRRMFLLPRITRRVSVTMQTEPKGHLTSDEWVRSVQVFGLKHPEILDVYGYISERGWDVAVNEVKTEDGLWNVELS